MNTLGATLGTIALAASALTSPLSASALVMTGQTNTATGTNFVVSVPATWSSFPGTSWVSDQPNPLSPPEMNGKVVEFIFDFEATAPPVNEQVTISTLSSDNAYGTFNGLQIFDNIGLPGGLTVPNEVKPFVADVTNMISPGVNELDVYVRHFSDGPLAVDVGVEDAPVTVVAQTPEPMSCLMIGFGLSILGLKKLRKPRDKQ